MTDPEPERESDDIDGRTDRTTAADPTAAAAEAVGERLRAAAEELPDDEEPTLLIGTDFDGTLAPITDRPDDAAIRPESREALRALRDADGIEVAVISGRALDDVRERVGVEGIDYAGNHGLEYRHEGEESVHPVARERVETVQAVREALEDELAGVEGAFVEDKRVTLTVHYRHASPEDAARVRETTREVVDRLGGGELEVTDGKEIVEVRPDVDWDKGEALSWFAERHEADVVPLFVGDDVSDEAGFRAAAPRGAGVRVGEAEIERETRADASVATPAEVTAFLRQLGEDPLAYGGAARRGRRDGVEDGDREG